MKAARFHEYGDVDAISIEEIPAPEPGEGEVSLRVKAAGVNPIDWKILHGIYAGGQPLAEPRGLGVDFAGVVERVGPGVEGVAPGDELLGVPSTPAYAEIALSKPELLVEKPSGVSWEVAGSLGVVVGTAYATLDRLALQPGETLLLAGASGMVGQVATQLAVARGVNVVGTAGEDKLARVRELGATAVPYGDGLAERLREAAPDGAQAGLDASGHGELAALLEVLGGPERLLTIADSAAAAEAGVEFHAGGGGDLTIPALREVLPLIEAGTFSIPIAGVYELARVGDALRESEHVHPAGKLVVVP